jgi:hypothetical protein
MKVDFSREYPLESRPSTPHWCENFALMTSDVGNYLSVFFNIGTWYADTSIWREVFAVALSDGRTFVARNYGRNTGGSIVSASLARYEIVEPGSRFRLVFDGPVWLHTRDELVDRGFYGGASRLLKLNLTFEAVTPLWDMNGERDDDTSLSGAMHTEQLGLCHGTLRFDGRELTIANATSVRDHSRGVRSGVQYKNHCWIQCMFPGNRSFHLYAIKLHNASGVAMAQATVIQDNCHYSATIKEIIFLDRIEDAREKQTIVLESALGEMKIDVLEPFTSFPVSFVDPWDLQHGFIDGVPHTSLFDGSAIMEWAGKRGVGWYERGFSERPLV